MAGQINGNPNFGPNDAAKIIVNQVNSNNPSLLRGYVEVAGQKAAAVVIANSSGLVVDGGGFINTSRGILTTGNPLIDGSGNLTGFNVTGGTITVQGAGLNASNIDQVDLIARAVQANAAIYANTLNVVTGANSVDYAGLNATPITGSGAAPGVSIDVAQLGGMYANRITLVGTEKGVGVANAGTIAAQAGDLTLTSSGQLVQSGTMNASGSIGISAASVANSGTIFGQRNTTIGATGALTNSGTLAAQQDLMATAGSVASTGLLGAGVNPDGSLGSNGNLSVTSAGLLSATGQNVASGIVTLYGVSLDLANAQTWAGTALALTATGGSLGLANATTGAGTSITVNAAGTLDNSGGTFSKTPDVNDILNQQADTMAAAQAAGQVVAQGIGAYAESKLEAAQKAGDAAGEAAWDEGGDNRALLHAAGGALIGGLGGGSAFGAIGGAAGAALSSKLAGQLESLSKGVGAETSSELLGNLAANVAAGVAGVLVGGTAGAATASNVELYNQMLHRKKDLVSQVCGAGAQCSDATLNAVIQAQGANADAAAGSLQPNYATANGGVLSANGTLAVNLYDGQRYVGGGVSITNPSAVSWMPSGTATLGWIFGAQDAGSTNSFLNGDGSQYFISVPTPFGVNAFGAITHAYGGSTAVEIGFGSPGGKTIGVMPWGHSSPVSAK
ncbi:filamentous hemagglutinin family protein [Paraburkholderia sp. JPY162]|uniref:Filamentous hemagglutinin family protein n=1 Tax=Paraburkholderia youngii TaxID=2782701 RepID=A0A7W8L1U2_9BURK|nr:filamentous hemagglutinin family protein [Paraburkholderia youngii]